MLMVVICTDGRHRHCGAILQGTKGVTSLDHVMEIQFHSDANDNTTQDFRHATRLLKGVWLHFTPGLSIIIISIIINTLIVHLLPAVLLSSRKVLVLENQFTSPCPWTTKSSKIVKDFAFCKMSVMYDHVKSTNSFIATRDTVKNVLLTDICQ